MDSRVVQIYFQASCGSLTNLLKIKVAGRSDSSSSLNNAQEAAEGTEAATNGDGTTENVPKNNGVEEDEKNGNQRKNDLAKALNTDLSRLDAMIEKAENSQYSMEHQRKQMKKFMN